MQRLYTTIRGRIQTYDNPIELVDAVAGYHKISNQYDRLQRSGWTGRKFSSWDDLAQKFNEPWPEGRAVVEKMLVDLEGTNIGDPTDIRRKLTLNEDEGEIDTHRLLAGEDQFYWQAKRKRTHAVQTVSLLCQLGSHWQEEHANLFWQGAATVAAIDLLEHAGYSVEVSMYSRAIRCYKAGSKRGDESFLWCKLKEAGSEVNTDLLTNCLSGWFFRNVVIGATHLMGTPRNGHGCNIPEPKPYAEYMDFGNVVPVEMPVANSYEAAVKAVRETLESVCGGD